MNHYGEWDPEGYKVGVLQALSAAEGRVVSLRNMKPMKRWRLMVRKTVPQNLKSKNRQPFLSLQRLQGATLNLQF